MLVQWTVRAGILALKYVICMKRECKITMKWMKLLVCGCLLLFVGCGCGHSGAASAEKAPLAVSSGEERDYCVACAGDSLTAGFGARSYVAVLAEYPGIVAENFGVCGTTAADGAASYRRTPAYEDSLQLEADVVVLMLGTNDSVQWPGATEFHKAFSELVDAYLEETEEVLLCTPLAPAEDNDFDIDEESFAQMCKEITAVAKEKELPLLDFYGLTGDMVGYTLPDGIHPTEETSAWMADTVYEKMKTLGWLKNTAAEAIK